MKGKLEAAFAILLVIAVVLVVGAVARNSPRTGQFQTPTNLLVARIDGSSVDVVQWTGTAWDTLVPPAALPPITSNGHLYSPEILKVWPNSSLTRVALSVIYCSSTVPDGVDSCFGKSYVYDTPSAQVIPIAGDEGDRLVPLRWSSTGRLFVDYVGRELSELDVDSGVLMSSGIPYSDYTMSSSPTGFSADENYVAISEENAERIWSRDNSTSTVVPGPVSYSNTPWMTFTRDMPPTAPKLAIVSQVMSNMLGGGALRIYNLATGSLDQSISVSTPQPFDYSPAWVNSNELVFLRGDGASWAPGVFGDESQLMPSGIMHYDLTTSMVTQLLPANGVRRALAAPDESGNLVFLQTVPPAGKKAYGMLSSGGAPHLLITDSMKHTAIGWPE